MFYRFAQANWKESGPSVLDHFSLHVPCSVIHTAPYTDTGNDKGMTKQRHKRQMAQRVSAGKPSRVLMALSLLLWLFARREMVKRPGKCFTECFAVLVIWNIKLWMLCKWRKWGWNLRFEKSSVETKFSRQCRKFKAHVLLTWIKQPNQLFGMSFCAKAFTDSDAEADSDVNQKWFHNMSMRYDLCEEGCHFVELMELFFHPGHNCPEKYTLVNEATRFFDFHFGFLFGLVFPRWNSSCFFFSIFFWAGRSSKGEARLSERLSTIMSVLIASHRFDARSQTKLSHLWWKIEILSHGVHRCSYGVHMGPWPVTFHPYPQICKIITNARFSIVFILGKPFDKMMKHCELLWTSMATWAFRAISSGVRPLRHGFCKHWKHAMPCSAIDPDHDLILETFVCWDMNGTVFSPRS